MNFDVREKSTGQTAGRQSSDGVSGSLNRARIFTVVTDDPANTTADDAQYAQGTNGVNIPILREPYPFNFFLRCDNVSAQQVSPVLYEVTCTYSAQTLSNDKNSNQDPTSQPAKVRLFPVTTQELVDSDIFGFALSNSRGDLYEPQPIVWNDMGISVQQKLSFFDPTVIANYLADGGGVNKDVFLNFPIGTCHIASFSAELTADPTNPYWDVYLEIHVRMGGQRAQSDNSKAWFTRIRNDGFFVLDAPAGNRIRARDAQGVPEPSPVLIKSNGTRETDPSAAIYNSFRMYPSIAFAPLGFLW